jgi:hypothetical protein
VFPNAGPILDAGDSQEQWDSRLDFSAASSARLRSAFTVAGRTVHLMVAGERLGESLSHPFAHLPRAAEAAHPDLTISAIDRNESPAPDIAAMVSDRTWNYLNHRVTASSDGRHVAHFIEESGSVWCLDRLRSHIIGVVEGVDRLSLYERGKTAQILLPFWLETQKLELIHAALIGRHGRGILITGPNGAGKSTIALTSLIAGFDYLGDDYIVLDGSSETGFHGHSAYGCAFLEIHHLQRFPALIPYAVSGPYRNEAKRLVLLHQAFPARLTSSARLEFLVLPRIGKNPTRLSPATRSEALRKLAPTSLLMLARPDAAALGRMAHLVAQLKCYWLDLGPDIETIPLHMSRLLDS